MNRGAASVRTGAVPVVAAQLLAVSLLARAPQGMFPLSIILLVQSRTHSMGSAGLAAGTWALGLATGQPVWARVIRHGGREWLIPLLATGQGILLVATAVLPWSHTGTAAVLGLTAGLLQPPVTAVTRTLWPRLAPDARSLNRLFTVDATAQEIVWVIGPALVGLVVALSGPAAALIVTGVIGTTGGILFALEMRPLWPSSQRTRHLPRPSLRPLAGLYLCQLALAIGMGLSEVAVPAAALAGGQREAAGWLLAIWSLGSVVGGGMAARWPSRRDPVMRIPQLLVLLTVGGLATAVVWVHGLGWLALVLFVAGMTIAPLFAAGYAVVSVLAPEQRRTEAFALSSTFVVVGLSIGSAVGGNLADITPTASFAAGALAYAVSATGWWVWGQRLRATRPSSQTGSVLS